MATHNRRALFLDHGRIFVEVPLLMTDNEFVAVFEDFVAEVHGRLRQSAGSHRRNRPRAARYPRIGTQKSADKCLSVSKHTARKVNFD
jgi:ATP-dependent DNA ligase